MLSKALYTALDLGLFSHISEGAGDVSALSAATGVPARRLETLIAVLSRVGLVVQDGDAVANAAPEGQIHARLQEVDSIDPARILAQRLNLAGNRSPFDVIGMGQRPSSCSSS